MRRNESPLLLSPRAHLALAPGLWVDGAHLVDDGGVNRYALNRSGAFMVGQIETGVRVRHLVDTVADEFALDRGRAADEVTAFLWTLDRERAVSVRQGHLAAALGKARSAFVALWMLARYLMIPSPARLPSERLPAGPVNVVYASLRSHTATVFSGLLIAAVSVVVNVVALRRAAVPLTFDLVMTNAVFVMAFTALMIGATVVHELGHLLGARAFGVPVVGVFVRPYVVGLSHEHDDSWRGAVVAVAGPFTALAGLLVVWWSEAVWQMTSTQQIVLTFALGCVGLLHIVGVTPLTADGRHIAECVRRGVSRERHGGAS